ncbi:MAG: protein kinase [Verrucomicrobiae bacterium]|nr:protein kinase [Verrucomicrobiae bacterium]
MWGKSEHHPPLPSTGRFAVGTEIARGGMGSVLEAEDLTLGRTVAMKRIRLEHDADETTRRRFIREAGILARLAHPNIVPIHELGRDPDGRLFYVMKKIEGRTLQSIINELRSGNPESRATYPLAHLLTIYVKICDAIAFAHSRGIIHRDLKPDNVMIGAFGEVLVMDWGLAKAIGEITTDNIDLYTAAIPSGDSILDDLFDGFFDDSNTIAPMHTDVAGNDPFLTLQGAIMGTPTYMPPEQAAGRIDELDERSDLYSLGGILYTILTRCPPFKGKTAAEVLKMVKNGEVTPPTELDPAESRDLRPNAAFESVRDVTTVARVPPALSAVTMRAMAVRPEDRYPTVQALRRDIEAFQGGFATSAEDMGFFGHVLLLLRRHQVLTIATAVALVLLSIVSAGFMSAVLRSERRAVASAGNAKTERANAETEKTRALIALGEARLALAEAAYRRNDASAMIRELQGYPEMFRATNSTWRYLWSKRDASNGSIPGAIGVAGVKHAFVPGHPGLLAVSKTNGIQYLDWRNGTVRQEIETDLKNACLAFSADGARLAVGSPESTRVSIRDASSGLESRVIDSKRPVQWVQLNRDGSLLVVCSQLGPGFPTHSLDIYNIGSGALLHSMPCSQPCRIAFHPQGDLSAFGAFDGQFKLFNPNDPKSVLDDSPRVTSIEYSPSGRLLALSTWQGELELRDGITGRSLNRVKVFATGLNRIAWASDDHLISHGNEGLPGAEKWLTRVWSTDGLRPVATFFGVIQFRSEPNAWLYDRQTGILLADGQPARITRIPIGLEHRVIPVEDRGRPLTGLVNLAVWMPSETTLLATGRPDVTFTDFSATPHRLPFDSGDRSPTVSGHHGRNLIAVAGRFPGQPAPFRIFAFKDGHLNLQSETVLKQGVRNLNFHPNGTKLLVHYRDDLSIGVCSADDGHVISHFASPDGTPMTHAVYAGGDDRKVIITQSRKNEAGEETSTYLLNGESHKPARIVTIDARVNSLAASIDGQRVAIGSSDGKVRILRADNLRLKHSIRVHDSAVSAVAFHPGQPWIATASLDFSIKVWNFESGELLNHYLGITSEPNDLEFSPSGDLLAVVDKGQNVRVWKLSETKTF